MSLHLFVSSDITKVLSDIDKVDQRCKDLTKNPVKIKLQVEGLGALDGALRSLDHTLNTVSGDISRIAGGIGRLNSGAGVINNINGAARGAGSGIGGMTRSMLGFAATLTGINLVSDAIGFLRSSTIDFSAMLQDTMVGFTTILHGNAEAAKGLMDEIKKFAIPTPFAVSDIAPLAQQVMAFNLVQKDAKDLGQQVTSVLRDVGDAAFGLGRGQPGVDRLVLALGQMMTATRVTGNDMLQLQSVGVNAWQYLAEATGKTTGEVRKLVSKGLVPAKEGIEAIRAGMRRDFGGAMEAASKTFNGAMSSIKDIASQKLSNLFAPAFDSMTDFAVKAGKVLQSREFDQWVTEFTGKIEAAFAFVTGIYDGFIEEVQNGNPIILGLLAIMGARFIWLANMAIGRAMYAAGVAIGQFAMSVGPWFLVAIAAISLFALAYQKNFHGIKDVTDKVVSAVIDGVKALLWGVSAAVEETSKLLSKVPDWALGPIGAAIKNALGDQTGLADGALKAFDDFDARAAKWRQTLQETFNVKNIGKELKGVVGTLLPDINAALNEAAAKAPKLAAGSKVIPHIDLADDGKDAKKKRAAALKILKDQLGDSAQDWDAYAKAVQKSAEDQIAHITDLKKDLGDFFGFVQDKFLALGVIDNPMGPLIASFEKLLDLAGRAKSIAGTAQGLMDIAKGQSHDLKSAKEQAEGKDGVLPRSQAGALSGSAMPSSSAMSGHGDALAYARSMLGIGMSDSRIQEAGHGVFAVTGKRDGAEWCVGFIQAIAQNQLGHKIAGGTLMVSELRKWGEQVGGFMGRPQSGDIMTMLKGTKGKKGYHSHTALVDQVFDDGTFSTIGGNEGNPVNSRSRVKDSGRYRYNDPSIHFIPGSALGGSNGSKSSGGAVPTAPPANAAVAAQIKAQADQLGKLFDTDPNAMGDSKLKEIMAGGFDGDLQKIQKLNSAWGSAVKDVEGNTVRFTLQTKLASKDFNDDLEFMARITGRSVPYIVNFLRKFANFADLKLNAEAKKEEMKKIVQSAKEAQWAVQDQEAAGTQAGEDRASMLEFQSKLLQQGTLDERERNDALDIEAARRDRINDLMAHSATLADATRIADQEAAKEAENRRKTHETEIGAAIQDARRDAFWNVGLDDVPTMPLREAADNLLPQLREALENTAATGEDLSKILTGVPLPLLEMERNARAAAGALDALPQRYRELLKLLDQVRERTGQAEAKDRVNPFVADAKQAAEEASAALIEYGEKKQTPLQLLQNKADIAKQNIEAMKAAFEGDTAALAEIEKLGKTTATYYTTAIDAAKQLADGESHDKVSAFLGDLTNQSRLNSIFDPLEAELARVKDGLKHDHWTDAEIEQVLPAQKIFLKTQWLKDRVHEAGDGIYDALLSSIDGVKDKGLASLGDFADGVLNQLNHLASQIIANQLWSSINGLFGNLLGGLFGGGVTNGGGIIPFDTAAKYINGSHRDGLKEVPFNGYIGELHAGERILDANEARIYNQAEAARGAMLSRSPSGGGASSGAGVTITNVYHVEKVVAPDTKKFTESLPGTPISDVSDAQVSKKVAQVVDKGRKHL